MFDRISYKKQTSQATSDYERLRVTTTDYEPDYEWLHVTTSQRVTTSQTVIKMPHIRTEKNIYFIQSNSSC